MKPEELAARLQGPAYDAFKKKVLTKAVLIAQAHSMERAPVRFGTLRRSITTRVEGDRGFVGSNVKYAPFVHEGTKYMTGRPFFKEGIEDSKREIMDLLQREADAFLAEVAG